jgi:hypothetical protein
MLGAVDWTASQGLPTGGVQDSRLGKAGPHALTNGSAFNEWDFIEPPGYYSYRCGRAEKASQETVAPITSPRPAHVSVKASDGR